LQNTSSNFNIFSKKIANPFFQKFFLFVKLPSAFFSGVKMISINNEKCEVSVPYKWFSQNPFNSTYFACLAMAAEMSTGLFAFGHCYKRTPQVSMLVSNMEGSFHKKAKGKTIFTCADGEAIANIIDLAITSGESQSITANAVGNNADGELVAEFSFTWSFKSK
jgi:acyl-coenzyme A thioesterase PaaI-like protein